MLMKKIIPADFMMVYILDEGFEVTAEYCPAQSQKQNAAT
jgi:hypothetical protein